MQPHSMAMTQLVTLMWNRVTSQQVITNGSINMKVVFVKLPEEKHRTLYYELSNITESADRRELNANVRRASGGINCQMTARRSSMTEGFTVKMTHGQQHVAGLMEEFDLYRKKIASGRHHNSRKYGTFSGDINYSDRLTLNCEVINTRTNRTQSMRYELEVTSSNYEVIDSSRAKNIIDFPQQNQKSKSWNPFKTAA